MNEKKLLHYTGKAIADFKMIETGDRVLVCLSGGKDSFALVNILHLLQLRTNNKFTITVFVLDQCLPGFDDTEIRAWLTAKNIPFVIHKEDTFSIVKEKSKTTNYCMLCSRLRRGIIYTYAKTHNFSKIALGHHRDDLIASLLMSIFYKGEISSMPPKLLTNDKQNIVIRPLCYCQEKDIVAYSKEKNFPLIPYDLCGAKENPTRKQMQQLIQELAKINPKIPSNMLHALQRIRPSQLMDHSLWDFKSLLTQKI
ncbi:MAG: tRNA 2-thiocytidine(32) synthetase TtcA [Gammaproteobacteria bacterium]|nr:tRNA 2-thiocytidine(32) synthetase TtcA [Gammaproteobacteria bacterium]